MYKSKNITGKQSGAIRWFILIIAAIMLFCTAASFFNYALPLVYAEETSTTTDTRKLLNGSFEEGQTWTKSYNQLDQSAVPSWNTTATDGKIELLRENTGVYIKNVKLAPTNGTYAAELNADEESTLYQNVKTTPSSVYEWGLDHGARNGTDTMALVIGPAQSVNPSKPSKAGRDHFMQMIDWLIAEGKTSVKTSAGLGEQLTVYSKKFAAGGTFEDNAGNNAFSLTPSTIYTEEWHIWIIADSRATSGENPWGHYGSNAESSASSSSGTSGTNSIDLSNYYLYTVPAGQTDTLFGFVSVGYVDSTAPESKAKTYGNFLDNINFQIYHPLSGSTTTHGSAVVGGSDGSSSGTGNDSGHKVTVDDKLATYVKDGEPLKIQAIVKKADADDGCEFVGTYYTKQDENGNPKTEFLKLADNEIEDTGSLTDEEKKGKWIKSTNDDGDIIYTYYLDNVTTATDLHFVFLKSPTVTYDPNGGMPYVVERTYNTDEAANVYSFKPVKGDAAQAETGTLFIDPYTSKAAEGQNDGWKFMGWLLTGDIVSGDMTGIDLVKEDKLGSLILPAEHTIACDYTIDGVSDDQKAQYFKIYNGSVSLTKTINHDAESNEDVGVTWLDNSEEKAYANVHKGITMVAQWRWLQAFIPQVHNPSNDNYYDSADGGTVEIISVTDTSDENYNAAYNANGGKSYHAELSETVTINATAKEGYTFEGWYDAAGNLVTTQNEYSYIEKQGSVNTYYARFSNSVTQTYIRQVGSGDDWQDTTDDAVGTLGRYSYTDAVGMPISSTATAGIGYKFMGWYDSEGNKVADDMLINDGATISYTTTGDATYYAR
ncbi:MAG: InlB B-repeat-containing protein, partial [Ruminococcus sp.]